MHRRLAPVSAPGSGQADFAYLRFHGRNRLFASNYTKSELVEEAKNIRRLLQNSQDVYVYFNNDAEGYAVANARTLAAIMRGRPDGDVRTQHVAILSPPVGLTN